MRLLSKGGLYQLILLLPLVIFFSFLTKSAYAIVPCDGFTGTCVILHPGDYKTCTPSIGQCNPSYFSSQTCNNGPSATNSGGCGTACNEGSAWTQYKSVCYVSGGVVGQFKCSYGIVQDQEVCSTADKYQPNAVYPSGSNTILDAGSCSCTIGGPYKICCGYDPSTKVYSNPVGALKSCPEGSGVCPVIYPYDGNCPGSYIDSNGTSETVITTPPGTTSCQTPPQPSSYSFSVYSDPSGISIDTSLWGSQKTSFTTTTTNTPVSFSAPATLTIGGQTYSFSYWNYGTNRVTSPSISDLSLKVFSSASAYYVTSTKYYYCKTPLGGPNVCTQTSRLYHSVTACQNALTAVSSTGICYPTQNACQQDPQCATVSPATYYYCSSNSCVSGKYSSISACNAANGTCYTSASCNSACGSATPPPANTGNDVSINRFTVNGVSAGSPTLACIPVNGVGLNDTLSWSATASNSCSDYTPQPVTECKPGGGTQTVGWSLSLPLSNPGTCSVKSSSGWSSSALFTNQGSGSFSPPVPANSTDYTLTCTRDPYTCDWTRPSWQEVQTTVCDSSGKNCTPTSTCEYVGTVPASQPINSSSQSEVNTLAVIQPPIINNFTPNQSHILIHKSTSLTWGYSANSSDSPSRQVQTNIFCYPGGVDVKGDPNGWSASPAPADPVTSPVTVTPLNNTTYNLICRNLYAQNSSCYTESNVSTGVTVYLTNLQESNTGALIENAFGSFLKKLGI